ncbi:MAG TPA: ATP-binding cassette domain-containing protein [Opitutaceae bacterium]|nr:ATP-binding cassette domain-containing protein [Opitutaceae bacterium]
MTRVTRGATLSSPLVSVSSPSPSRSAAAVVVRGLVKRYDQVEALRGIDLEVRCGEMFALLGPNGAGKTTLFSILATLRAPTAGTARVLDRDVITDRAAIRRDIGIVFQEPAIEQRLSGRDNLLLMGLFYGLKTSAARERAAKLLSDLGLADAADRPARTLSGGQRRKLELARALVTDPQILFLDEATLGLDVDARRGFWAQVRALAQAGRTVFFTTHYMEEAEVADRIALIDGGAIAALDTPAALKARLGGGVIRLETEDDARSRAWLGERGLKPEGTEKEIMLVHPDPAAILPDLLRSMPIKVRRVSVEEPSLEDVFLTLTGRGLNGDASGGADAVRKGGPR